MKALIYHGPGNIVWEDKPMPVLQKPTDAVVRITRTTLCGTDLHILKGDVPEVPAGLTLGHEGVGVLTAVGRACSHLKPGDRVLISCITSCGRCKACQRGMYSHCADGGWLLGHLIDGTQAEYVRIPHAERSLHKIPAHCLDDEPMVMLSDVLPTGYECGVLNGEIRPGDTVLIVGAGPIGLAALLTAKFFQPAKVIMIDPDPNRRQVALVLGATQVLAPDNAAAEIMRLTAGQGVDVAIEAVGVPETFGLCQATIAAGGRIANVGLHGRPAVLHLEKLWAHNITIRTRLVDTVSIQQLLTTMQLGKLNPRKLITHHFPLNEIMRAYDTFGHAARENALKVILTAEPSI